MPSGRTHDRITLWSLPFVAGLTFGQTQNGNLTLLVSGGFLFGGLMFGPDLDIYSRQFQRWGWLRWIWIPYQTSLRHRSFLSHGPIIGTALRSLYLVCGIAVLGWLLLFLANFVGAYTTNWQIFANLATAFLIQYPTEWIALFIGLELGAMSHSLSDWGGSAYKRLKKGGLKAILPKAKKGKSPRVRLKKRTAKTPRTQRKE
ncbi:metal-binding protein [Argonema galeatum]|uniref:metal-binding protein n=1 Tax=Argonema galeatum TaxID=2942762 RepID=UPI002010EA69|nr:metal-binding protein [Argonema galeatum]MCL1464522.1 metal-binding protein [Argonema galeatum A003/A1]